MSPIACGLAARHAQMPPRAPYESLHARDGHRPSDARRCLESTFDVFPLQAIRRPKKNVLARANLICRTRALLPPDRHGRSQLCELPPPYTTPTSDSNDRNLV